MTYRLRGARKQVAHFVCERLELIRVELVLVPDD
jgi:hypothetical protein